MERFASSNTNTINNSILLENGLESLNIIADYLLQDLPIETIERFERLFKDILKGIFTRAYSSDTAREVLLIQKRLGFLLKYKSYAIKAANPLGYSIFLQNQGQGFSFQQHIAHKTEVFISWKSWRAGMFLSAIIKTGRSIMKKKLLPIGFPGNLTRDTNDSVYFRSPGRICH